MASVLRLVGASLVGLGARTEEIPTNQPFLPTEGSRLHHQITKEADLLGKAHLT